MGGLPFTFLLFWMSHGLIIVCKEEAGEIAINRKNFEVWVLNWEEMSFVSFLAPFVPVSRVAEKTYGGSQVKYLVAYGAAWITMIVFLCLTAVDRAFLYMGAAM